MGTAPLATSTRTSTVSARIETGAGTRTVEGLAALLVVAVIGGIVALHRMVSVALAYAERRSNFVAAVTHELKTPLTAIRMYGEMLRDGLVASESKRDEYHRTITGEAERLSRLIDDVLELSRLERGSQALRLEIAPLEPLVRESAALLEAQATRAGLALRVHAEPDLPPVHFDRDALHQIVTNLVENAIKYAKDGEGDRAVRLSMVLD